MSIKIENKEYNFLTAIKPVNPIIKIRGVIVWEFKCICGRIIQRPGSLVKSGNYKSCGCRTPVESKPRFIKIIKLHLEGKNVKQIAKMMNCNIYTVYKYLTRYRYSLLNAYDNNSN